MSLKKNEDQGFRGVGLFDDEAGSSLRSDPQLGKEILRTVAQVLRTQPKLDPDSYRVEIHAHGGRVKLRGTLPDLGSRRLVLLSVESLDSVSSVDADELKVPGFD